MMPWSVEQQRLLRGMGYVLYELAPAASSVPAKAPAAIAPEATGDFARLRRALQAAASGHDVSWVGDLATLRGDARAKRALWPKLRSLRRAAGASGSSAPASVPAGPVPDAPDAA
jgi:hypothetical protein